MIARFRTATKAAALLLSSFPQLAAAADDTTKCAHARLLILRRRLHDEPRSRGVADANNVENIVIRRLLTSLFARPLFALFCTMLLTTQIELYSQRLKHLNFNIYYFIIIVNFHPFIFLFSSYLHTYR